jgi:ADP-heptose:LPS heptosyltransferase
MASFISTAILRDSESSTSFLPSAGVFRVLVCRPTHSLGNTLLLTPLLRELQVVYPGAEIDVITRTPVAVDLFGQLPHVRHVLCLPSRPFLRPMGFFGVLAHLRRSHYDLAIDPHPCSRTGRTLLRLCRATYKLGFSGHQDAVLTHAIRVPESVRHTGHRPVHLLRNALGYPAAAIPALDIALTPGERTEGIKELERLLRFSRQGGSHGTIGVFANATGHKLLPESWWQSLLNALAARYSAHAIVEIVPAFGRSMLGSKYPAFYTSDVRRLAGVLSQLSLFVSSDCGVMHLACASGAPVVGFFSITNPVEWGPYGSRDCTIDTRGLTPEQIAEQIVVPADSASTSVIPAHSRFGQL